MGRHGDDESERDAPRSTRRGTPGRHDTGERSRSRHRSEEIPRHAHPGGRSFTDVVRTDERPEDDGRSGPGRRRRAERAAADGHPRPPGGSGRAADRAPSDTPHADGTSISGTVGMRVRGGTVPRGGAPGPVTGANGRPGHGPGPAATVGGPGAPATGGTPRPTPAEDRSPGGAPATGRFPAGPVPATGAPTGGPPPAGRRPTVPPAPSAPGALAGRPGPGSPGVPSTAHPDGPPSGPTRRGPSPAYPPGPEQATGRRGLPPERPAGENAPGPGSTGARRAPLDPAEHASGPTRRTRVVAHADDAATRAVPAGDGVTRTAPSAEQPTRAANAADVDPRSVRRRRAEPDGRFEKIVALVSPGIGIARTKLGILDAEQKAALTPEERTTRRRKQIRYSLIGSAASLVLLPLLLLGLGWALFPIPNPDDAVNNQIATVSFTDGEQLARLVPEQGNRIKVGMDAIPPHVREAVLAAEDRSFYSNPGFDFTGILRAAFSQLTGGIGGGSTITQQYVKNTLVGNEATYWRKYKELVVSLKVSGQKSKDEILNDYLNAIYFGRGAYGIESASLAYFGKPAAQLNYSEGALLAGVIQSPSNWDPANSPDRAKQRWSFVLDGMTQQGWITKQERQNAVFPQTIPPENTSRSSSLTDERGHILNAVRSELGQLGISEQAFAQGGLQVTTTIDPGRQQQLTDAVNAEMKDQPDVLRTGAVAIDPRTGGIVGYYGGANGTGLDYAQVMKQPGSTFKPFAVLAGLLQDPPVGLGTVFDGSEQVGLRNAEGANCPRCDLKQAMTISNNVVFTKLAAQVGPQKVADAARLAGITAPLDNPDARLPLGNKEITPLQLASAYSTLAAGGVWHAPHMVSKVVDSDGRVLYEAAPGDGEQRFSEDVARNVTEAMMNVVENDGLGLPGGQKAAGKTGTVQSRFEGQNNDAWFAGFTPDLATAVWVGTDRNDPIQTASGRPIGGRDLPGGVWHEFMSDAVRAGSTSTFPAFEAIGKTPSDRAANEPAEVPRPAPSSSVPAPPPPTPTPERPAEQAPATPESTPAPSATPNRPGVFLAPDDSSGESPSSSTADPTGG